MVGPLQSAYKHELGISHGTDAAHAFTQAAVGVHYGKLIARLGHNVVFACLSPWARVVIAMIFMFVGVLIPPVLVFTLGWHWVGSVFIAYMLSGLGLGIFEVTFLSVITPLGKATKSWAIIGCPSGFATINILSHFNMENWPAVFYMFHPPKVPLFNPKSDEHLMKWGQFFAITYIFIFLGDSISRRIAI